MATEMSHFGRGSSQANNCAGIWLRTPFYGAIVAGLCGLGLELLIRVLKKIISPLTLWMTRKKICKQHSSAVTSEAEFKAGLTLRAFSRDVARIRASRKVPV